MALHATVAAGTLAGPWVYNDFLTLLTGAMTDQPVTLKYTPGSGTTPALTLKSDSGRPLLKGIKPDGVTQAFLMDENGNLTVSGNLSGALTTGLPTNRNAAATSVPIYTGTTTPTSPPTGSIWVKA